MLDAYNVARSLTFDPVDGATFRELGVWCTQSSNDLLQTRPRRSERLPGNQTDPKNNFSHVLHVHILQGNNCFSGEEHSTFYSPQVEGAHDWTPCTSEEDRTWLVLNYPTVCGVKHKNARDWKARWLPLSYYPRTSRHN